MPWYRPASYLKSTVFCLTNDAGEFDNLPDIDFALFHGPSGLVGPRKELLSVREGGLTLMHGSTGQAAVMNVGV